MGRDWLKQRSSVPPGSSVHVYYNRIRNYSTSYEVQPKLGRVQLCDSFSSNHWKFTGSYGQSIRQCICRAKASTHACLFSPNMEHYEIIFIKLPFIPPELQLVEWI